MAHFKTMTSLISDLIDQYSTVAASYKQVNTTLI